MTNELAETTVQRDEWKRIAEDRGMEIERLHAAVKTAQELAATRLMEVERLKELLATPTVCDICKAQNESNALQELALGLEAYLMTNRDGDATDLAVLIDNLIKERTTPHEPLEQPVATPGAARSGEDSVWQSAESSRPRELLAQQMEPDISPLMHQEIFSAVHHHAAEIVKLTAAVPAQCTQGASRDASPVPSYVLGCVTCGQQYVDGAPNCACGSSRTSPADLVGALQDVVHSDPGPVRAGKAVKSIEPRHLRTCARYNGDVGFKFGIACTCGASQRTNHVGP